MKPIFFPLLCLITCGAAAQQDLPTASTNHFSVEQIVADVLAKNPEANFYRAEVAAARGERRRAGALNNPELAVEGGAKRQQEGGLAGEGLAWSVSVNQTFEFPGRLALRKAIANRQIELAELGYAQFRAALASRARALSLSVASAGQIATTANQVADRARELAAVMVQRDAAGVTPLLEIRILEASAVTAMRHAAEAQTRLRDAAIELNQLRGAPLQADIRIEPPQLRFPPPAPLEELLASARTNNFELKAKTVELEQQGFKVELTRNERYPSITVSPFYSEEKARDFERQAGIGVSIPLPLWNRGKGDLEIAEARRTQAETMLLLTEREIERRLIQAHATYSAALTQLSHWPANAAQHFREAAELGDRHFRLGAIPISTYIELQTQYVEAIEAILTTEAEADAALEQTRLIAGWIHAPQSRP